MMSGSIVHSLYEEGNRETKKDFEEEFHIVFNTYHYLWVLCYQFTT